MADNEPLKIGAFSTLSRLSVRMLRYYDSHGVLSPASIDQWTGYRYYEASQLPDAVLVRQLRDVGFSVSAIAALLPLRNDPETLDRALAVQRDQLLADAAQAQRRIAELDQLVKTIKETTMSTITTVNLPEQRIASWRMQIPNYWSEGIAWDKLMAEAGRQGIALGPEPCGATFWDDSYQEAEVDVEVWLPLAPGAQVAAPLVERTMPPQRVVVATLNGPYDQIDAACDELADYISEHGLRPTGQMFNRYLVGPGRTDNPAEFVTEICQPIG